MKIATYNVNGVNGRLPVLLRWLQESKPDIAVLQELKAPSERFPIDAIRDAGYHALWKGQKQWNGVAILSREPIAEVCRELPGDAEDLQSRYIEAVTFGLCIAGLYLPNGNPAPGPKLDYKLAWIKRLQARAAQLVKMDIPVVLLGDFNVIPTENDVYKPERWVKDALFLPEVRAEFETLIAQGWTDALRTIFPTKTIYTFWDYFRRAYERDAGLRIDHLLLHPKLVTRLQNAGVDKHVRGWEKTSDHAPVWIELSK